MNKLLTTLTAALLIVAPATASAKSHATTATPATTPATTAPAATTPAKVVNVNTASAADLATIPGISAKIAADVIKNRPYKNKDELVKKVKGIGPKNVLKMLPYMSF